MRPILQRSCVSCIWLRSAVSGKARVAFSQPSSPNRSARGDGCHVAEMARFG